MSFVNYKLFQMVGLYYPPQIQTGHHVVTISGCSLIVKLTSCLTDENGGDEEYTEKIYSLAKPLAKRADAEINEDEVIFDIPFSFFYTGARRNLW